MLIFILISVASLSAQDTTLFQNSDRPKDTLCFKYHFYPGDTLVYHAVAFDSISIDYGIPLLREREEIIRITCDSIKKGRIYLSQTLLDYKAKETQKKGEFVDVNFSEWLGRTAVIVVDTLGRRLSAGIDDSTKGALSPGGAFNEQIIVPIGASCKHIRESWRTEAQYAITENGHPGAVVRETYLYRLEEAKDTLGTNVYTLSYISTGQGNVEIKQNDKMMKVTNIINGSGKIHLSSELMLPVHYFANSEQKLTIMDSNGGRTPGIHFISINYTLVDFKPGKNRR